MHFPPPVALKRKAADNVKDKDVFNDDPPSESESSDDEDQDDESNKRKRNVKGPRPEVKRAPEKAKRGRGGGKVLKVNPNDTVTQLLTELVNNQRLLMKKKTPTDTAVSLFKDEYCEGLTQEEKMSFIVTLASSPTDVNIFLAFDAKERVAFIRNKVAAA
jgi:hypothetical protein